MANKPTYEELEQRINGLENEIKDLGLKTKELKMLNDALASSINAVGITDLHGNLIYVNNSCLRMWGYDSKDQMLGRSLVEFWEGDGIHNTIGELQENGVASGEDIGIKKDGSLITVQFSANIIKDESNNPEYMFGSFIDITEHKQTEVEIRETHHLLNAWMENSPSVAFIKDLEGRITFVNRSFEKLFDLSPDEILGKTDFDLYSTSPETAERMQANDHLVINQGKPITLEETVIVEGELRHFETLKFPLCDISGNIMGLAGMANDITERKQAEKALKESESKYRTLFENMAQGTFYQRADGVLIDGNKAVLEILGLTRDQFLGRTSYDQRWKIIQEDGADLPVGQHPSMLALNTGKPVRDVIVGILNPLKEDYVWVNINAIPQFREKEARPYQVFVTMHDITERRNTEQREKENLARLRLAMDGASMGVWEWDFKTGFMKADEMALGMVKYGAAMPLKQGEWWISQIHPDDRDQAKQAFDEYLSGNRDQFTEEFRLKRKDGKYVWIASNAAIIRYDNEGQPALVMGFHRDITKQKEVERALIEQKQTAERYLNIAGVMFIGLDVDGNVNVANKKACEILEYNEGDILGLNWFENFIPQTIQNDVRSVFKQLIDGKMDPVEYYENPVISKNGTEKFIAWHNTYITDNHGNIMGVLGSGEDITERRALESQLHQSQKMEAIGTLSGGIAHDFNNILAIILGNAELASDDVPDTNPATKNLEEIRQASLRAKEMVQQLLSFSRKTDEKKRPLNMVPIIKESMKMLRSAVPSSVEFRLHILDEPCNILGDAAQINQIVINLVTNAVHAMPEDGLIEITLKNVHLLKEKPCFDWILSPGDYVALKVKDTGEGMAPETMARIFEPYFTTKEVGKGTGMGLSVVHGIVKRFGGGIRVESVLGKGTLFEIYFPELERMAENEKKPEGDIKGGSEMILFVDDEEAIVKLNHQRLERLGYLVKSTTKPVEALEWFKADPDQFDAIITDMTMPRMTGDALVKKILTVRPQMPVIVCTGYSERMSEEDAETLGVHKYMVKPLDKRDLASALREVLSKK